MLTNAHVAVITVIYMMVWAVHVFTVDVRGRSVKCCIYAAVISAAWPVVLIVGFVNVLSEYLSDEMKE